MIGLIGYLVLTLVALGVWTPIGIRFFRAWRDRGNPVSLAICAAITLLGWEAVARIWVLVGQGNRWTIAFVMTSLLTLVGAYFHFAFEQAKKLPDRRH